MSEIIKDNKKEFKPAGTKREFKPGEKREFKPGEKRDFKPGDRKDNKKDFKKRKPRVQQRDQFEERVIQINRITKVTKGGRVMRFAALVVVGDRKGQVAIGTAKANEVPVAIKKAIQDAKKNLVTVVIAKNSTVFHEITGKWGASKVLIKPAPEGKGIIAGGAIRSVVELSGIKNIYTKNLGSNNPINIVRATINALSSQVTSKQVAFLRDKELSEL